MLNSFRIWSTIQLKPPPPPPYSHTLSVYTADLLWGGGGGEVRGKVKGQHYTRGVVRPWGKSSQYNLLYSEEMKNKLFFSSWVENTNHE
jgi:hypothetical protein